tara:strand:+ start:720 stop:851 length:132 start_codon:yes stop_codon:yes gene_type:complete
MNNFYRFWLLIIILITSISCGKKSILERYPDSDFPRDYPVQND